MAVGSEPSGGDSPNEDPSGGGGERPAAASTGKGPRSLLARAVLFVCVIPLSVAAAFYLLLGTLIYSTAPERTRPSAEIAATGLDGREVAIVPYLRSGMSSPLELARFVRTDNVVGVAAVDLATGEHVWDRSLWKEFRAVDTGVLAAGGGYAYLSTDLGLRILETGTGETVAQQDGIDGLGADYIAARAAYAFDPDAGDGDGAIVALSASGEILAIPVGSASAVPADPTTTERWRDVLNTEETTPEDAFSTGAETSGTAELPDGTPLSLHFTGEEHEWFVLESEGSQVPAGADQGFVLTATNEMGSFTLAVADPETFGHRHSLDVRSLTGGPFTSPSGRVTVPAQDGEEIGLLVVATADGITAHPVGRQGLLAF
ncbi:hypothetical protein GCM10009605_60000 [Nocardiopsis composta]